jgi:hypothetical protein
MARKLIQAGPAQPCESCGTRVRVATYEGGRPRLNEVRERGDVVSDLPGGHTPLACQLNRR